MTITPYQAANETEALWEARRAGRETDKHCGWCELQAQSGSLPCRCCPVQRVAGVSCRFMTRLIVAARKILDEVDQ